ncbi:uncharacterized protein NPIL_588831 [Nephila pilipes]|uniref:Methyltransferase domain-containing protein n=1 Tax=Nephila pilipes TaxID=299642 RepID=A0A8X6P0W9_NEPPI|nr:uncharacterized protein NPIL_588831 [Nephila pilipes]
MDIELPKWTEYKYKAVNFIYECKMKLNWKTLTDNTVMDVRCGMYFSCCRAILNIYPDVGCVIALQNSRTCNDKIFPDEGFEKHVDDLKVTFSVADIETRISLQDYKGKIDKVVSWNAFHEIRDKERALESIFSMLKPGGEVAISFYLRNATYAWQRKMFSIGKWNQYLVCTI